MKTIKFIIATVLILAPISLLADGGLIPPPKKIVYETDQKAVIFFDEGVERLVISINYTGNSKDFAWIIPTPSQPEITPGINETYEIMFEKLDAMTSPKKYVPSIPLGGAYGIEKRKDYQPPVTVVERLQVKYYDITVLLARDADKLAQWLNRHGYQFPDYGRPLLDEYIADSWYFTAVKVNDEKFTEADAAEMKRGRALPLELVFKTDKPVFPMKLTKLQYYHAQEGKIMTDYDDCIDSDNGFNTAIKGYVKKGNTTSWDNCRSSTVLNEMTCVNGNITSNAFVCKYGCEDGRCLVQQPVFSQPEAGASVYFRLEEDVSAREIIPSQPPPPDNRPKYNADKINVLLYVFARDKYYHDDFSVQYEGWMPKEAIRELAFSDEGSYWFNPSKADYYLTRLYANNYDLSKVADDVYFKKELQIPPVRSQGTALMIIIVLGAVFTVFVFVLLVVQMSLHNTKK